MFDEYRGASDKTESVLVQIQAVASALSIMVANNGDFDTYSDFNNAIRGLPDLLLSLSNDALGLHSDEFSVAVRVLEDA